MLLKRLLLTRNAEVFEIKEKLYSDVIFYMILLDYRRSSEYKDFSHIIGYDEEDFSSRDNYIQALLIYNNEISDNDKEETYEIVSGFLEDKEDCDWSMKYIEANFEELRVIGVNTEKLLSKIEKLVLLSTGNLFKLSNINTDSFKYLFQD